jgi:hypothetical protein
VTLGLAIGLDGRRAHDVETSLVGQPPKLVSRHVLIVPSAP